MDKIRIRKWANLSEYEYCMDENDFYVRKKRSIFKHIRYHIKSFLSYYFVSIPIRIWRYYHPVKCDRCGNITNHYYKDKNGKRCCNSGECATRDIKFGYIDTNGFHEIEK